MGKRCSFGISRLTDTGKERCDRGTDIITQQNGNRAGKPDDTCAPVRSRLGSKVLEYSNRSTAALHHQCHQSAHHHTEHRYIGNLGNHSGKNGTGSQRLHHTSHGLDSQKQKTEGKYCLSDIFYFFRFGDKGYDKACKDEEINIITDLKSYDLRRHGGTDVGTENNGDCLWQRHQPCTDKPDRHNRRCAAAL